jgi:hypothetical protein
MLFAPSACVQAPFALLPEGRDVYGVEPGSEGEKYFVECVLQEARLQARVKHPYVTKVYVTAPVHVCVCLAVAAFLSDVHVYMVHPASFGLPACMHAGTVFGSRASCPYGLSWSAPSCLWMNT